MHSQHPTTALWSESQLWRMRLLSRTENRFEPSRRDIELNCIMRSDARVLHIDLHNSPFCLHDGRTANRHYSRGPAIVCTNPVRRCAVFRGGWGGRGRGEIAPKSARANFEFRRYAKLLIRIMRRRHCAVKKLSGFRCTEYSRHMWKDQSRAKRFRPPFANWKLSYLSKLPKYTPTHCN